jgi:hypothetical protein
MSFPGALSRFEAASGLLVRSIKINGHYLFVDSCNINPDQEIDLIHLIQGGPGAAIANIGIKKITGQIACPIRVNRSGLLDPAVKALLQHAERPTSALRIDTNHVLSHVLLTAEAGGTDNNQLLSLDTVVVSELKIKASPDGDLQLTAQVTGMIDARDPSDYAAPAPGQLLGRELSWGDCEASRWESQMRTLSSLEITITNEVEALAFIQPIQTLGNERDDQIDLVGIKSCKWGGKLEEVMRVGAEKETHIHGGWMQNENLKLVFGPITATLTCPLFKIAEVPLTSKALKRTTAFFAQIKPNTPMSQGGLFAFSE